MEKVIETLGTKMPRISHRANNTVAIGFEIPFINQEVSCEHSNITLIETNWKRLVSCVEARMKHCVNELLSNLHNVCKNDGQVIVYKDGNTLRHFSVEAYNAMGQVIEALKLQNTQGYSTLMYDQLLKAVIKYGHSYCVEDFDAIISYLLYRFKESKA